MIYYTRHATDYHYIHDTIDYHADDDTGHTVGASSVVPRVYGAGYNERQK